MGQQFADVTVQLGRPRWRSAMKSAPSALLQAGQIRGDGAAQAFDGQRDVRAVFGELNLPLLKSLEAQLALRYYHCSDAGSTTNAKLGLRWTPSKQLLRGSYGSDFRALTLPHLYAPQPIGQTSGIYYDVYCPQVKASSPNSEPGYCGLQPHKSVGGSRDLKPATADAHCRKGGGPGRD